MSVTLNVTHSTLTDFKSEKYFALDLTIAALKQKLEFLVGTSPKFQVLQLKDADSGVVVELADDTATLQSYGPADNQELHVKDVDPAQSLEQIKLGEGNEVPKFEISEERYNEKSRLRNDPAWQAHKQAVASASPSNVPTEPIPDNVVVGAKCIVKASDGKTPDREGTVMFVGTTDFGAGNWVGVKFNEALGKNNGTVKDRTYFICEPQHGSFVRPNAIVVVPDASSATEL